MFIDANANGRADPGETGAAGVRVSNGREVTTTDSNGRYQLPKRDGFVALSRPRGFEARRWYARGAADFALVPASDPEEFFFVQVSDSHVFARAKDFQEFSTPALPSWMPQLGVDWLTLWLLDRIYGESYPDGVAAGMRRALIALAAKEPDSSKREDRIREIEDQGDVDSLRAYTAELETPGSPLGDVAGFARRAFEEVAALAPDFIVNTGDLVLEGNSGSAEAVSRWFEFYDSITQPLPVPIYNTIGNNEIAGNQRSDFSPNHPAYGKRSFEARYGPAHYSFGRGAFHFIALDTHRPDPTDEDPKWWSFGAMDDDVRSWLEADLAASTGSTPVVFNHEPFHVDPTWPLGEIEPADDAGLFARFAVPYVLTGHTHFNSFIREGSLAHIGTGALSGMRWILPPDVHPRGYRLFWARADGTLHSAWKHSGKPLIALAEGGPDPGDPVLVVADVSGPFASVEVTRNGQAVQTRAWGNYFLRVEGSGSGALVVIATTTDGRRIETTLALP